MKDYNGLFIIIKYNPFGWSQASLLKFCNIKDAKEYIKSNDLDPSIHRVIDKVYLDCLDIIPSPSYNSHDADGKNDQAIF